MPHGVPFAKGAQRELRVSSHQSLQFAFHIGQGRESRPVDGLQQAAGRQVPGTDLQNDSAFPRQRADFAWIQRQPDEVAGSRMKLRRFRRGKHPGIRIATRGDQAQVGPEVSQLCPDRRMRHLDHCPRGQAEKGIRLYFRADQEGICGIHPFDERSVCDTLRRVDRCFVQRTCEASDLAPQEGSLELIRIQGDQLALPGRQPEHLVRQRCQSRAPYTFGNAYANDPFHFETKDN